MSKSKFVLMVAAVALAASLVVPAFGQLFSSIQVGDGSKASPSLTFVADNTAGLFRSATGVIGVSKNMSLPNIQSTQVATSQAANSCAPQSYTVTGVAAGDYVALVSYPATGNALGFGTAAVTAANTVAQVVCNPTAGALNTAAGTYVYLDIKPQ